MKIEEHVRRLLGRRVQDKVTGFKGVVTCVSFDLYGCIQAVVAPQAEKSGKVEDSRWYDVARLEVVGTALVMPVPDFASGYIADGLKGAAEKPAGR